MDNNTLIFQILGVLAALFFCFLTYMNTRVWRATHVTFAFLVFCATIAFVIYASMSLKTRSVWMKKAAELEVQLEKQTLENVELAEGKRNEIQPTTKSIRSLHQEIAASVVDRGRVWRNCTLAAAGADFTLNTVPPADPNAPAAAALPNHMEQGTVVHAFLDMVSPNTGAKVPGPYLGQFYATNATDQNCVLSPTLPLDNVQRQFAAQQGNTWTLYETMPIDNYDAFAGLTEDQLKQYIPQQPTGLSAEEYDALIKSYLRTGGDATDNDPPASIWVEVKFLKKFEVVVNSDAAAATVTDGDAFDSQGRAVLPRLKKDPPNEKAEFEPGETAVFFDNEELRQMIADGVVQKEKNIYRRPLNHYTYSFNNYWGRTNEIIVRTKEINRDIASITKAIANTQKQIDARTAERTKVQDDLAKTKYEVAQVTKYRGTLDQQLAVVRARVNELYRTNKALGKEIADTNARLTREIDEKTKNATAMLAN